MDRAHRPHTPLELDISHIQIEDGQPVDNIFSGQQMRLLTETLYASWKDQDGNTPVFTAFSDVGLFYALHEPPVVPDVMVSLGFRAQPDLSDKKTLSYFIWEYGKPPDIVIEIVSNRERGEDTTKREKYASIGVAYYVIYDPDCKLSKRPLRGYERHGNGYVELLDPIWLPQLGLGLCIWEGEYEFTRERWLRWVDQEKRLLRTGAESAAQARLEADLAQEELDRAREQLESAREAAAQAQLRNQRLAERLQALGIDESDL